MRSGSSSIGGVFSAAMVQLVVSACGDNLARDPELELDKGAASADVGSLPPLPPLHEPNEGASSLLGADTSDASLGAPDGGLAMADDGGLFAEDGEVPADDWLADGGSSDAESDANSDVPLAPPFLGAARAFVVLGGASVRNVGVTALEGVTGAGGQCSTAAALPSLCAHRGDTLALEALRDAEAAYDELGEEACDTHWTTTQLADQTLPPGVHCFDSSLEIRGKIVMDGRGLDPSVFVLKVAGQLKVAPGSTIAVLNCAHEGRVYWHVGGSAEVGAGTKFVGNLLTQGDVTLGKAVHNWGRFLAHAGDVSLDTNDLSIRRCEDAVWLGQNAQSGTNAL